VDKYFQSSINARGESRFIKNIMSDKDYGKYAYFVSKASNFAIVIRPNKKKIVDGEVVYEEGLRLEFHNKMLRLEKGEANDAIIEKLRVKIKEEEGIDPKRRSFFEETKPKEMVELDKVETLLGEKLGEKNERIAALEDENARLKSLYEKKEKIVEEPKEEKKK
jgi:uncharacterized small protein (DUF1192 family)